MESKLESDIEERKQPLLGSPVPPLNFETLKPEDEPLRQQVDEGVQLPLEEMKLKSH